MRETSYHAVIAEMTVRALWELQNLLGRVLPHLQRARAEAGLGLNKTHHHAHVAV